MYYKMEKDATAKFLVQTEWFNEAGGTISEQLGGHHRQRVYKGKAPPGTWFAKLKVSAGGSWTRCSSAQEQQRRQIWSRQALSAYKKKKQTQRHVDSLRAGLRFNSEADFAVGCVALVLAFWLLWPITSSASRLRPSR